MSRNTVFLPKEANLNFSWWFISLGRLSTPIKRDYFQPPKRRIVTHFQWSWLCFMVDKLPKANGGSIYVTSLQMVQTTQNFIIYNSIWSLSVSHWVLSHHFKSLCSKRLMPIISPYLMLHWISNLVVKWYRVYSQISARISVQLNVTHTH